VTKETNKKINKTERKHRHMNKKTMKPNTTLVVLCVFDSLQIILYLRSQYLMIWLWSGAFPVRFC